MPPCNRTRFHKFLTLPLYKLPQPFPPSTRNLMIDPKSNLAEQLAYALRHHQKNQQELESKQEEIEKLRAVLAQFKKEAESEGAEDES